METYIAALDQGTTTSRAILFNSRGEIVSKAQYPFRQIFPQPGWVEHDPMEIWATTVRALSEAVDAAHIDPKAIAGIGITNQRETAILWDRRTGQPVYNAIVWQCRRTAEICDRLKADGLGETVTEKTGLLIDAYFSGTKLKWIMDNIPGVRQRAERGELCAGTVDSWLIWNLTGGKAHVTDYSNASRTMLFNIHTMDWDAELLTLFGIPRAMCPQVLPSSGIFGETDTALFGALIPIAGVAGDQQSALFGQGCHTEGDIKNTYGTGGFLLMNTGERIVSSAHGLLSSVAWQIGNKVTYALEGSVFVCGAAIQWLRDGLGLIASAGESEALAASVPDTGGVYFVPAFVGLGTPYWDPYARGTITGITRGTTRAHIVRATLEAMAFQTVDVLNAMQKDTALPLNVLRVDGGAAKNNLLLSLQSNFAGVTIERPVCVETTAWGAAALAGLATGIFESTKEIRALAVPEKQFIPQMSGNARERALSGWHNAVRAAQCGAHE